MVMTKNTRIKGNGLKCDIPKSQVRVLNKRNKLYEHIELMDSEEVIDEAMASYISTLRYYLQVEIDKLLRSTESCTPKGSDIYSKMRQLKSSLIDSNATGIEDLIKVIINDDFLSKYREFEDIYGLLYIVVEGCYVVWLLHR